MVGRWERVCRGWDRLLEVVGEGERKWWEKVGENGGRR